MPEQVFHNDLMTASMVLLWITFVLVLLYIFWGWWRSRQERAEREQNRKKEVTDRNCKEFERWRKEP